MTTNFTRTGRLGGRRILNIRDLTPDPGSGRSLVGKSQTLPERGPLVDAMDDGEGLRATVGADALDLGALGRPRAFRGPGKCVPRLKRRGGSQAVRGCAQAVRAVLAATVASMLLGGADAQGFALGEGSMCVSHESCLEGFCKARPGVCSSSLGIEFSCGECAPCIE
jgi:hypothetical protein